MKQESTNQPWRASLMALRPAFQSASERFLTLFSTYASHVARRSRGQGPTAITWDWVTEGQRVDATKFGHLGRFENFLAYYGAAPPEALIHYGELAGGAYRALEERPPDDLFPGFEVGTFEVPDRWTVALHYVAAQAPLPHLKASPLAAALSLPSASPGTLLRWALERCGVHSIEPAAPPSSARDDSSDFFVYSRLPMNIFLASTFVIDLLLASEEASRVGQSSAVGSELVQAPDVAVPEVVKLTDTLPLERVFDRQGAVWRIRYAGVETTVLHSVGMSYIAMLLGRPNMQFTAEALRTAKQGGKGFPFSSSKQPVNARALATLRKDLARVQADITKAQADGDTELAGELRDEQRKILAYVAKTVGYRGNRQEDLPDFERARSSVSHAIDRAMKAILVSNKDAWRHLRNSLEIGKILMYKSGEQTHWRT